MWGPRPLPSPPPAGVPQWRGREPDTLTVPSPGWASTPIPRVGRPVSPPHCLQSYKAPLVPRLRGLGPCLSPTGPLSTSPVSPHAREPEEEASWIQGTHAGPSPCPLWVWGQASGPLGPPPPPPPRLWQRIAVCNLRVPLCWGGGYAQSLLLPRGLER
ncbi:proline-rich receptor-like protein kinase PERK2 [Trachypithecus francoisi]|uniref:proline-rich receptor-like protein kinase PERK2 n=1 Tax=Trachypithecus francoisi TaxID=54180 RepID=UPI00141B4FEE|nr:proline-rich receptor-like protein kinase PERK2 [Trachypithecus francoisi]